MNEQNDSERASQAGGSRAAVRGRLGVRLAVTISLIVLLTAGVGMLLDFRRLYNRQMAEVFRSLRTVANSVGPARRRLANPDVLPPALAPSVPPALLNPRRRSLNPELLSRFLDNFVRRIETSVAPGHHILVFDAEGDLAAHAAHPGGPAIERELRAGGPRHEIVQTSEGALAVFRLKEEDEDGGATILAGRHLDRALADLRDDLRSRAMQIMIIAAEIILLLLVAVRFWVLRPVNRLVAGARAWSRRDFDSRVEPAGSPEFHELCGEFNRMAGELSDHEERRRAELSEARNIQARLLPGTLPQVMGLEVAARYQPAAEVGGDLFDVFSLARGQVAAAVLDVAGHGISAALLTGVVKMSLRYHLLESQDLVAAVKGVSSDMLASSPDERFVTLCVGVWNPAERTWTYVAAGHPGGVLLTGGQARKLDSTGAVLGAHSEGSWQACRLQLQPGDRLFLFSDGVVEAGAPKKMLGMAGVADLLGASTDHTLRQQVDLLAGESLARQTPGYGDDVTILAMEVREGPGPAVLGE